MICLLPIRKQKFRKHFIQEDLKGLGQRKKKQASSFGHLLVALGVYVLEEYEFKSVFCRVNVFLLRCQHMNILELADDTFTETVSQYCKFYLLRLGLFMSLMDFYHTQGGSDENVCVL